PNRHSGRIPIHGGGGDRHPEGPMVRGAGGRCHRDRRTATGRRSGRFIDSPPDRRDSRAGGGGHPGGGKNGDPRRRRAEGEGKQPDRHGGGGTSQIGGAGGRDAGRDGDRRPHSSAGRPAGQPRRPSDRNGHGRRRTGRRR